MPVFVPPLALSTDNAAMIARRRRCARLGNAARPRRTADFNAEATLAI